MNKAKKLRLELARLLKFYEEAVADDGTLIITEGALEVGAEVFTVTDSGEIIPLSDGEYKVGDTTYTVEAGVIAKIEKEEQPVEDDPNAETPAEETPNTDDNTEVEGAEEEVVEVIENENAAEAVETIEEVVEEAVEVTEEMPEETEEDKDAKIAELEAKIEELEAIIEEYKAKEVEPVVEDTVEEEMKKNKLNRQTKDTTPSGVEQGVAIMKMFRK